MSENNEHRNSNFTKEETSKLMMLLKDYPVITSKKTDHASNKQKDAAWKLLLNKFNSDTTKYRSVKQLQQKYNNMKKTARKEMAEEKYGRRQTGGGPPPPKPSETTEWLNSLMKESISGLDSVYDSDAMDNSNLQKDNYCTQDASGSAVINLEFLDDTYEKSLPCNNLEDQMVTETNDHKENTMDNNDITQLDTSTPKAMLRKPVSKELVCSDKKRKLAFTPLETRKQIILHTNKKNELLSRKQARELEISKFAKEEHEQNLLHKKAAHEQYIRHQEELHELEVKYKKQMFELMTEKCKLEAEKAKLELSHVCK